MAKSVARGVLFVFIIIFTGVAGLAWLLSRPWAKVAITEVIGKGVDAVLFTQNKKGAKKRTKKGRR